VVSSKQRHQLEHHIKLETLKQTDEKLTPTEVKEAQRIQTVCVVVCVCDVCVYALIVCVCVCVLVRCFLIN